MTKILEKLTEIYCFVDDLLKQNPPVSDGRRGKNRRPHVPDAEVRMNLENGAIINGMFGARKLYNLADKRSYFIENL